jgi:hypothetical protein
MDKEYFDIKFEVGDELYEGQVWPDEDENNNCFCQVTYHKANHPENSEVIYVENKDHRWVQKIVEDGEKMASPEFIEALNKQIDRDTLIGAKSY